LHQEKQKLRLLAAILEKDDDDEAHEKHIFG
jgi:hypothetical protein